MTYTVKFKGGDEAQVNADHLDITNGLYLFSLNGKAVFVTQTHEVHYTSKDWPIKPEDYQDGDVAVIKVGDTNLVGLYNAEGMSFYSSDSDSARTVHRVDDTFVNAEITVVGNVKETL